MIFCRVSCRWLLVCALTCRERYHMSNIFISVSRNYSMPYLYLCIYTCIHICIYSIQNNKISPSEIFSCFFLTGMELENLRNLCISFAISTGFAAADLAELDLRKAGHRSGGAGSDCLERLGALIKEVLSGCVNVYINIYILM